MSEKPWYEDIKDRFHDLENSVSYMRGELDEMKRHNQKTIKTLMRVITVLIAVIGSLLGLIAWMTKG